MLRSRSARVRAFAILVAAAALLAMLGYVAFERVESPTDSTLGVAFVRGAPELREVALTYDDGPNPPYTERILDVLRAEHVRATFFLVGRAVVAHPSTVRAIVREGSVVGGHGWDHDHWTLESDNALRTEQSKTFRAVTMALEFARAKALFGDTFLVRPPYGQRGVNTFNVIENVGETPVLWSVPLSEDWTHPGIETIVERSTKDVRNGDIIVLHDGDRGRVCAPADTSCSRAQEAPATREIIERLRARGFAFVTIPEMIAHAANSPNCRMWQGVRKIPMC